MYFNGIFILGVNIFYINGLRKSENVSSTVWGNSCNPIRNGGPCNL